MTSTRFLADEDLRGSIISAVRRLQSEIEFLRVVDMGLLSASDEAVLEFAHQNELLLVSHDVTTMRATAEHRVAEGQGIHGLILTRQSLPTRAVADDLVLIWTASQAEEWIDRIVFLPL